MTVHPQATKQIRRIIDNLLQDLQPPVETPESLDAEARAINDAIGVTHGSEDAYTGNTIAEWRADYQPWTTDEEWRDHVARYMTGDLTSVMTTPGEYHWTRWTITRRIIGRLVSLGVLASCTYSMDWSGSRTLPGALIGTRNKWTGKRWRPCMVLGWPTRKWRCLIQGRHWPSEHLVAFGFCAKCLPCPDCGNAAPVDHECGQS